VEQAGMTTESVAARAGKLTDAIIKSGSRVCVGLDPHPAKMPIDDIFEFNRAIIDSTYDLVAAYKPQLAFYEALGLDGLHALKDTIRHIREVAPDVLIIGDAKRGDTGNTAEAYAQAMFEQWGFDATTVQLYQGTDSLEPFLGYEGKLVFVCCRTSNESSVQVQDIQNPATGETVYETVAKLSVDVASHSAGDLGLVVGATFPEELSKLRKAYPNTPFLIPGVGAQGGDAIDSARRGGENILINSSRGVIYASHDESDFAEAARTAVDDLRLQIELGSS
jgi:orotidine-5'-phosphate decarboxylase